MAKTPTGFLRISAVAARLGVHADTIRRWSIEGRLPPLVRLAPRIHGWPSAVIDPVLERIQNGGTEPLPEQAAA